MRVIQAPHRSLKQPVILSLPASHVAAARGPQAVDSTHFDSVSLVVLQGKPVASRLPKKAADGALRRPILDGHVVKAVSKSLRSDLSALHHVCGGRPLPLFAWMDRHSSWQMHKFSSLDSPRVS